MIELRSPTRNWPAWAQVLLILGMTYGWIYETFLRVRRPGDPQLAFILTLILLATVFIASELLRPKPKFEEQRPKGLGDFKVITATQGRAVPLMWGTVMQEGANVIWYGDLVQQAITKKFKTGLFSSGKRVTIGFKYFLGLQFGLCRGDDTGGVELRSILVDDKAVFTGSVSTNTSITIDEPDFFGGDELGNGGLVGTLTWRVGSQTQPVVNYLTTFQDVDPPNLETPRYVGTCMAVWEGGEVGNSTSIAQWKFELRRIVNGLGLSGNGSVNSGNDCNLMNVAFELFTNTEWGFGFPAADIDTANWIAAANTLTTEGNGFSMILDNFIEGLDFLVELQRQMDGIFFLNHQTGKWQVKLARDDYVLASLKPVTVGTNLVEIRDYSSGTWQETSNVVRVKFNNRLNDYAEDEGLAQDMANAQIQGGGSVLTVQPTAVELSYPGIKDSDLANQIAWRDLRTLARPLTKATLVATRDLYATLPGDVLRWTDTVRGFVDLPVRVQRIDYGELREGRILLDVVQDVDAFRVGAFGKPPATKWVPPVDTLVAYPADEQLAFEAPRGFRFRDPELAGIPADSMIWAAARRQGPEVQFRLTERNAAGTPSGSFFDRGVVLSFMRIGSLDSDLASGTGIGTTSFLINATPDTQTILEAAFEDNPELVDQGTNLINIIMVGDSPNEEFMLVGAAADSGADVNLTGVHRGILDGAQRPHSTNDPVYLIFVGGGLADSVIPPTNQVHVRLLPESISNLLDSGDANQIAFTMDRRLVRPYCPSQVSLNNVLFDATLVDLDFLASGAAETTGIDLDFIRRDFRTGGGLDEIPPLSTDAASIFADFPAANSYTTEIEVIDDPLGSPTTLFTLTAIAGTQQDLLRISILEQTDGVIPSLLRIELSGRHDFQTQSALASRNALLFDFTVASASLAGEFNFGARAIGVSSNLYTVDAAGIHAFTLSSTSDGDVEININGGGFVQLIAAGLTTGSTGALSVSDTILIRHQGTTGLPKQLDLNAPGAGTDGYMILR